MAINIKLFVKLLLPFMALSNISVAGESTKCSLDEHHGIEMHFDRVLNYTGDDYPSIKGRKVVIVTPNTLYERLKGEMLDPAAVALGKKSYIPTWRKEWTMSERVYSIWEGGKPSVRKTPPQNLSDSNLSMKPTSGEVKPFGGVDCEWSHTQLDGNSFTEECTRVLYGWRVPLFENIEYEGKRMYFSEVSSITERCVHRDELKLPEGVQWMH